MELINTTRLVCGFTMATDGTGRERIVVVAKGTYGIPENPAAELALLPDQASLIMTDQFTGAPGTSALAYENDFAPMKPHCDVLLCGSCHAPGGRPARSVPVALGFGLLVKAFNVVGPRHFRTGLFGGGADAPQPFTSMPISYDNAYGGIDRRDADPARHRWFAANPAGRGFGPDAEDDRSTITLPNTEELDRPVKAPGANYRPMAFGPLGRSWTQRSRWAGTYDHEWLAQKFPFLPEDFDARYFQSAPEDQQVMYPCGGEEVVLRHLTPAGRTAFRLPAHLGLPVLFASREGGVAEVPAVVDTVMLEPDRSRLMLVWRASMPVKRTIREITHITVGHGVREVRLEQERAQRLRAKRRFKSLAEAVQWARERRRLTGGP